MSARMAPPRRGVPYYDVASGRRMIVPQGGGGAVPFVGAPAQWSPQAALRRAGIRATARADTAARGAPRAAARAVKRSDVLPELGGGPRGVGGLLVYAFATIIALALLENALGGRGPGAVSKVLAFLGGAIGRLVSPNDPLIPKGPAAAAAPPGLQGPVGTPTPPGAPPGLTGPLGLVAPIAKGASFGRVDQGVDYSQTPAYRAVGAGTVYHVSPAGFGGGTGAAVYYRLDQPVSIGGRSYSELYVAETTPLVKSGQRVVAGQPIATGGAAELGFANPASTAPLSPPIGGLGAGTKPSQAGSDFKALVDRLLKGG